MLDLRFVQRVEGFLLIHCRLLDGELRINRICESFNFLLREIILFLQLFGLHLGRPHVQSCRETIGQELLFGFFLHFGSAVLRADRAACVRLSIS